MASGILGQILRFGMVGGVGFVVDGGLLLWLTGLEVHPYLARAISFPIAVVVTWWLNRQWTFRAARQRRGSGQFRRYLSVQVLGSLTNYLIYAMIVALFGTEQIIVLAGLVVGSAAGSILNFIGARYYAFRAHIPQDDSQI